jgi:hypothetical protein
MTVDEMPVDKMASCHFGGKGSFTLALFVALAEANIRVTVAKNWPNRITIVVC